MAPIDELEGIRFPIGRLTIDPDVTESKRMLWIAQGHHKHALALVEWKATGNKLGIAGWLVHRRAFV